MVIDGNRLIGNRCNINGSKHVNEVYVEYTTYHCKEFFIKIRALLWGNYGI